MKIGPVDLGPQPVLLAPMEDVTDIGFRLLCRRMGAAMVYSEFVAADALVRLVNKSLQKLRVCDEERPVAIQIYGKDPGAVAEAAEIVLEQAHPDVLDINFGCPVKRVAGKGAGAGLLQDPDLMCRITRAVVDRVGDRVPVTVKTRLDWTLPLPSREEGSEGQRTFLIESLAERLQDQGISALTIHGRTRSQMYTGEADWTPIGRVKANPRIRIPIIGNGDIDSAGRCREAFERYGVDAVMIGRATFGRPWIFAEIKGQTLTPDEQLDVLKQQALASIRLVDEQGKDNAEYRGILHVRRHLAASPLFKGIPNFRQTRIEMLRAESLDALFEILERCRPMVCGGDDAVNF